MNMVKFNTPGGIIHVPGVNLKLRKINGEIFYLVDEEKLKEIISALYHEIEKKNEQLRNIFNRNKELQREINSMKENKTFVHTARNSEEWRND